ncbi:hypothetical protein F5B18DRAFT_543843 [Nemania serpens]|nr:hypothetical protein F5B18DRAFT_543843 [Nemania serpens]
MACLIHAALVFFKATIRPVPSLAIAASLCAGQILLQCGGLSLTFIIQLSSSTGCSLLLVPPFSPLQSLSPHQTRSQTNVICSTTSRLVESFIRNTRPYIPLSSPHRLSQLV